MSEKEPIKDLAKAHCKPCEGGRPPLSESRAKDYMRQLNGWDFLDKGITKTFSFKDYYQTIAFVNTAAFVSHREDHHPDLFVSWGACRVFYTTHKAGGLTENDFICAAKLDKLLE